MSITDLVKSKYLRKDITVVDFLGNETSGVLLRIEEVADKWRFILGYSWKYEYIIVNQYDDIILNGIDEG